MIICLEAFITYFLSPQVVYFTAIFPYVVLFILLVRGLTLEGAAEGVLHYLKPNFTNMVKPEVYIGILFIGHKST